MYKLILLITPSINFSINNLISSYGKSSATSIIIQKKYLADPNEILKKIDRPQFNTKIILFDLMEY